MNGAAPLLEVEHLTMRFGGLVAIDDVSFVAGQRKISAIIGPNGAGKTTVFNCLTGFYKPTVGQLTFHADGHRLLLEQMDGFRIARAGVARTFQNIRLFGQMSVLENLEMGAYQRERGTVEYKQDLDRVYTLFPRLKEREGQKAGTLSGGEQQMLAMGRALMARPQLLLLDEPSMGLAPIFVERIFEIVVEINAQGTTVLLVEQNALMALDVAERGYVIETGHIALAGLASELKENEQVRKTYLGET